MTNPYRAPVAKVADGLRLSDFRTAILTALTSSIFLTIAAGWMIYQVLEYDDASLGQFLWGYLVLAIALPSAVAGICLVPFRVEWHWSLVFGPVIGLGSVLALINAVEPYGVFVTTVFRAT
jgi:hypothetical protein